MKDICYNYIHAQYNSLHNYHVAMESNINFDGGRVEHPLESCSMVTCFGKLHCTLVLFVYCLYKLNLAI